MKNFVKRYWLSAALCVLSLAALVVAWAIAYAAEGNDLVVPSVGATFLQLGKLLGEAAFWKALLKTLLRALAAVAISFALAAVCVILGALYAPIKAFFAPVIAVFRVVPTMAVTLILILAFPRSYVPIIVTSLVMFPLFYAQISAAADGVDKGLLQMAAAYGVGKRARITKIILPQIAPNIIFQLGTQISFAIKLTVSAEVLANVVKGIGGMMQTANYWLEIARLAALTLVSVAVGLLVELAFFIVSKTAFKWRVGNGN